MAAIKWNPMSTTFSLPPRESKKTVGYSQSVHTTTVMLRRGVTMANVNIPPPTGTTKVPTFNGYVDRPCWDAGGTCSSLPPGVQPGDAISTPDGEVPAVKFFDLGFELPPGSATLEAGETKKELSLPLVLGGVAVIGLVFGFLISR